MTKKKQQQIPERDLGELLRENAELRHRLSEAEQTLEAIRNGEVDALVAMGPGGDQVFTLQGAERPYRLLVEEMPEGAATVSADGSVLYANRRFSEMLGLRQEAIAGASLLCYVDETDKELLRALMQKGTGEACHSRILLRTAAGRSFPALVALNPLDLERVRVVCLVITDMTEESERQLEARLVQRVAIAASRADDLSAALQATLNAIAELTHWTYGEAWVARADGEVLEHTSAWYSLEAGLDPLRHASMEADLPPGMGLPGRAWISKTPVWIRDIASDKGFFGVAAARELGLKAAVAIPLVEMDEVIAVLVFYLRQVGPEDDHLAALVGGAAGQMAVIIDRKAAQDRLRAHEAELRQAQEIAHLGNWSWDVREDRMVLSNELYRIAGITPEMFGRTLDAFLEHLHPEDRPLVKELFEQALASSQPFESDIRILRPDGEPRIMAMRGRVVLRDAGRPSRIVGILHDITERKTAEQSLQAAYDSLEGLVQERTRELVESRARITDILSSITESYYSIGPDWRFTDINDSALRYFGKTREELVDKIVWDVFPVGRGSFLEQKFQEALKERRPITFEFQSLVVDRWAEMHVYPSGGHLHVYFSDITDRKTGEQALMESNRSLQKEISTRRRIEQDLKSSEERYRAIVENQPDLVSRFLPDGTLTFVNEAFCEFLGRTREELLSSGWKTMVHPDDVPLVERQIAEISPEHPSAVIENRVLNREGQVHWFQWTNSGFFDEQGRLVELQAAGRDFSARKEVETHLALQYNVTRALVEAPTLIDATKRVLQILCEGLGWDLAILWRSERPRGLRFEAIWHAPKLESVMVEQSQLPESEIPRRVLKERQAVWVSDLTAADVAPGTTLPGRGFRSVIAFPVRGAGGILAVIECFSRTPIHPHQELLQTLDGLAHQIGNFRDRKAAEEAIRRSAEELETRVRQRTEQLAGALEALSNSEMRFRAVFEGAPLGITVLNMDGLIMERNPTLEKMLGYPEGALYGRSVLTVIHPDDLPEALALFRDIVEGRSTSFKLDHRFVCKDGTVVWGAVSCSIMRFEGEASNFVIMMIKDITERKVIEQELRESETRFRKIFEESPIGIALVDESGRFVQANPSFLRMVLYEKVDLLTMTFEQVTHPDDLENDRRLFGELVRKERTGYSLEKRYLRKGGAVAWGNMSTSPLDVGDGAAPVYVRLVEDITARKSAEQRLRMLGHTITSMNESVLITDIHYRVISVNKAFERTFGYAEHEVTGRDLSFLPAPGSGRRELTEILSRTQAGGWTGEVVLQRKDGGLLAGLVSTSVVRDETGSPVAFVGILRDITEQKRLQEQLAEAERRRSEDLRRFALSVQRAQEEERQRISRELHDDICQRLSGMKLNMEVLEDDVRLKDARMSRVLRGFRKQFEGTIAEVRRLSSNLRPTVLDDFGLAIALNLLVREFQKSHKVKVTLEADASSVGHLDPQLEIALYRIAQESLTNIGKHARATAVTVHLRRAGGTVELRVRDDGVGFDSTQLPRAKRPGHGLGLISMKERAELIGGKWTITSEPGQGTSITVTLPLEGETSNEKGPDPHRG